MADQFDPEDIPVCGRFARKVDEHVGGRIRSLRAKLGVRRDVLARKAHISRRKLQAYEAGIARPSPSELSAVATTLIVPISYFFDGISNDERASVRLETRQQTAEGCGGPASSAAEDCQ